MRRLLVLLTLFSLIASAGAVIGVGAVSLTACGGNDKPPLTPDGVDPTDPTAEAGAPAPATMPAK